MSKELSAPLLRTARLLDLVPYLHANQGISIKDLADEFGVSQAQIQSDLTTLWMCGLPGYTPLELIDLEFESGYVTIRNASTLAKPRKVSFEEGLALLLGLQLLQQTIPLDRHDLKEDIEALSERFSNTLGVPKAVNVSHEANPGVIAQLNDAIKTSGELEISYHSLYSDEITSRRIRPLRIFNENHQNYLQAYCYIAEGLRIFRIDRILRSTVMERLEGLESLETTKESTESGISQISTNEKNGDRQFSYAIKVSMPTRDIAERFGIQNHLFDKGSKSQEVIELESFSQVWVERAVLATGADVELIGPADLRKEIYNHAKSVLERYNAQ